MEKHKCKLCSRVFANGRALGGHMKAHLAPLPIPPKHFAADSSSATSSSSLFFHQPSSDDDEEEDDVSKSYTLKKKKNTRKLPDPDVHDGDSETESRRSLTRRRRSKRKARPAAAADPEPASSVSETSPEEDAAAIAMCLIMLSRDTWPPEAQKRHRCEICSKVFRSSQALGGHRVTHRKPDGARPDKSRRKTAAAADDAGNEGDGRIFRCPYCYKVFSSGQALGGHKRSHVMGPASGGGASAPAASAKTHVNLIDLNLPAPEEEDDGSVVSDADITDRPIKTVL